MSAARGHHPDERKSLPHYAGVAMVGVGVLLILSAFFTGAGNFGSFHVYAGPTWSEIARVTAGVILTFAGIGLNRMAER